MKTWRVADPRAAAADEIKIVSPVMVHKASTVTSIQESARAAGVEVLLEGGKVSGNDYADHAEAAAPVVLGRVTPETRVKADWAGKERTISLATTEFFIAG